jgi:hypothetical protein
MNPTQKKIEELRDILAAALIRRDGGHWLSRAYVLAESALEDFFTDADDTAALASGLWFTTDEPDEIVGELNTEPPSFPAA